MFTTLEVVDYAGSLRVRAANGRLSPFSRDTLFLSLYKALGHRKDAASDAGALAATIIAKLRSQTQDGLLECVAITRTTLNVLKRFDEAASVQYAAYHRM